MEGLSQPYLNLVVGATADQINCWRAVTDFLHAMRRDAFGTNIDVPKYL